MIDTTALDALLERCEKLLERIPPDDPMPRKVRKVDFSGGVVVASSGASKPPPVKRERTQARDFNLTRHKALKRYEPYAEDTELLEAAIAEADARAKRAFSRQKRGYAQGLWEFSSADVA